jgi:phospholipase/carboxylesterase
MTTSFLECLEIETATNPTHSVIWLHGLGADGHDFAGIVPELGIPKSKAVRFIFPHAPVKPITINGGMSMRAWYDIRVPTLIHAEDEHGIYASEQSIIALIERENSRGVPTQNIVLAGFSQGSAMTLHIGLRYTETLAGLIALSGYLPLADQAAQGWSGANRATPIFLAHGTFDPVVTFDRGTTARDLFLSHQYHVSWHAYPMPHSVCPEEIRDISDFLKQTIMKL